METAFTHLYSDDIILDNDNQETQITEEIIKEENEEFQITEEDVQVVIKELKGRKAPGIDEIKNEFLKYGERN
ncbi:hypothetical protein ANN_09839 [Periplaneta americana]|uniref:Uncharacterized protein n=1 Tax=Periplaneta americana TaxID=6978 RepID=A0ABQ8TNW4_PERAM|nr:hypothetical protein ANN_09839 [Periplaneta americana]